MPALARPSPPASSHLVSPVRPAALSIPDACTSLGIGRTLLYRLINEKQIRSVKIGGRALIPTDEIDAFMSRLAHAT